MPRRHLLLSKLPRAGTLLGGALLVAIGALADASGLTDSKTMRVSVATDGTEADGLSETPSLSASGRFVAFASVAANLVADDGNGVEDVFVHDLKSGATSRISVDSSGAEADSDCVEPSISANGRYVSFKSTSALLVPGDANGFPDVFVHDRKTGTTTRVSVATGGAEADGQNFQASISANGRAVAFVSRATNLVNLPGPTVQHVFVHDLKTGETTLVSADSAGIAGDDISLEPALSASGRYVCFSSQATNLVPNDGNGVQDVFVRDRKTGQTTRVSVNLAGIESNGVSGDPSISANGRFVAFRSGASNLAPADSNGFADVFVHDLKTGLTTRASVDSSGSQADGASGQPRISASGRHVAFLSQAGNLVPGDGNALQDVFLRDRVTGLTTRISVDSAGSEADGSCGALAISATGRFVAFDSGADNLVAGDGNVTDDVFVHDRK